MVNLRFFLLLGSLLLSQSTFSLPEDRNQLAQLSANSADLNQQTHCGKYWGKVEFDQGTSHLRAAKAITKGNNQNKLILAIAYGDKTEQAHYWTQPSADQPLLHAYANEIHYCPEHHLIKLIGNAKVIQGKDSLTAEKIIYNTLKQQLISRNPNKTRTTFIFHPGKKI